MAKTNATTKESFERREKIRVLWAGGMRSLTKLAQAASCDHRTVRRDLVILRREARRSVKTDKLVDIVRMEEDAGLLQDIEQLNVLIQTHKADVNSLSGLIRTKLMARRQRAELWGLISTKNGGINVNVKAEANANANAEFAGEDRDLQNRIAGDLQDLFTK